MKKKHKRRHLHTHKKKERNKQKKETKKERHEGKKQNKAGWKKEKDKLEKEKQQPEQRSRNKKSKCSDHSHSSAALKKTVLVMSQKYTPVTQSILRLSFYICWNNTMLNTTLDKNLNNKLQFMILTCM